MSAPPRTRTSVTSHTDRQYRKLKRAALAVAPHLSDSDYGQLHNLIQLVRAGHLAPADAHSIVAGLQRRHARNEALTE